ncbi:MAG: hypothetical protein WDA08_10280 [Weeksellaceae bacterium]
MKIRQNSWRIYLGLSVGLFFILLGFIQIIADWNLPDYAPFLNWGIGLLWVGYFYFNMKNGFFKITEDELILYGFNKNKVLKINELKEIKFSAGDYIFKDGKQEIRIIKEMIDKKDFPKFEEKVNQLKTALIDTKINI